MSLPVALDTNPLVCLLPNDDPHQARRAADLIEASSACFVPITVVLELEMGSACPGMAPPGPRLRPRSAPGAQ